MSGTNSAVEKHPGAAHAGVALAGVDRRLCSDLLAIRPKAPGAEPLSAPTSIIWVVVVVAVPFVFILAVVAFQFIRNFDPGVRRAEKRAAEGDLEGAIAELREQIEEKGPTQNRVNALGIFLMGRERWDEAAAMFRKADAIGEPNNGVCRANLGLALLKGGKPAEAIPVLEEAARIGPQTPVLTCVINLHTAMAKAELGRWDEARSNSGARKMPRGLRQTQRAALRATLSNAERSWSSVRKSNQSRRGLPNFRCGRAGQWKGWRSIDLDLRPTLPSRVEERLAVKNSRREPLGFHRRDLDAADRRRVRLPRRDPLPEASTRDRGGGVAPSRRDGPTSPPAVASSGGPSTGSGTSCFPRRVSDHSTSRATAKSWAGSA